MLLILAPLISKLFNPHITDFQDFNLVSKKNPNGTTIKPKKKRKEKLMIEQIKTHGKSSDKGKKS
jgi:hypothetical protein